MNLHSEKIILLMRHAKSSWRAPSLSDYERPLDSQGSENTHKMAGYLAKQPLIPDQIFSSPALRARSTTEIMINLLNLPTCKLTWNDKLYFTDSQSYIDAIHSADESSGTILIVGHNPMIENVLGILTNRLKFRSVNTGTIICLQPGKSHWKDVQPGECSVKWIVSPSDLREKCSQNV